MFMIFLKLKFNKIFSQSNVCQFDIVKYGSYKE